MAKKKTKVPRLTIKQIEKLLQERFCKCKEPPPAKLDEYVAGPDCECDHSETEHVVVLNRACCRCGCKAFRPKT